MTLTSKGRQAVGLERLTQIKEAIARGDSEGTAEACRRHVAEAAEIASGLLQD